MDNHEQKKKGQTWLKLAGGVGVAAVLGLGSYFLYDKLSSDSDKKTADNNGDKTVASSSSGKSSSGGSGCADCNVMSSCSLSRCGGKSKQPKSDSKEQQTKSKDQQQQQQQPIGVSDSDDQGASAEGIPLLSGGGDGGGGDGSSGGDHLDLVRSRIMAIKDKHQGDDGDRLPCGMPTQRCGRTAVTIGADDKDKKDRRGRVFQISQEHVEGFSDKPIIAGGCGAKSASDENSSSCSLSFKKDKSGGGGGGGVVDAPEGASQEGGVALQDITNKHPDVYTDTILAIEKTMLEKTNGKPPPASCLPNTNQCFRKKHFPPGPMLLLYDENCHKPSGEPYPTKYARSEEMAFSSCAGAKCKT